MSDEPDDAADDSPTLSQRDRLMVAGTDPERDACEALVGAVVSLMGVDSELRRIAVMSAMADLVDEFGLSGLATNLRCSISQFQIVEGEP